MALSERISIIIKEEKLNQRRFAQSIFATEGYVSRLLKDGIGMSNSTAMLIEKVHGYSKEWILHGTEPKKVATEARQLTPLQKKIIAEIGVMTDDELFFVITYIEAVKKKKALDQREAKTGDGGSLGPAQA